MDLIHTQHHHNNHTTTPHMRVGPSVWGPPSCEGLLCDCWVGVVNLTFSFRKSNFMIIYILFQVLFSLRLNKTKFIQPRLKKEKEKLSKY
jgi:hypothetical protein